MNLRSLILTAGLLLAGSAQAYTIPELRTDCQAAEPIVNGERVTDPGESLKGARCIAYLAGFADSYAVSDYLASKVGILVPVGALIAIGVGRILYKNGLLAEKPKRADTAEQVNK